jgi:hypothetical protein
MVYVTYYITDDNETVIVYGGTDKAKAVAAMKKGPIVRTSYLNKWEDEELISEYYQEWWRNHRGGFVRSVGEVIELEHWNCIECGNRIMEDDKVALLILDQTGLCRECADKQQTEDRKEIEGINGPYKRP